MQSDLAKSALMEAFQRIAESSPCPAIILDVEGRVQFYSPEVTRIIRLRRLLEPGADFEDLFVKRDREAGRQFFELCLNPQIDLAAQRPLLYRLRSSLGKCRRCELHGRRFRDGEQTFVVFYLHDRTRELRQRRSIRELKQMLSSVIENVSGVAFLKNLRGEYQLVNRKFEEHFDLNRKEVDGRTDFQIFDPERAERFHQNDHKIFANGETQHTQEVAATKDGPHTYVSVKFPVVDPRGRVMGVGGISTDITDQMRQEQEIQAAKAVQTLLYPRAAPDLPGYEVAGAVRAAETVSGDYYDYISMGNDRVFVAVGDVSGHGLAPALEMVEVRSYLRAILRTEIRLDTIMECLNDCLVPDLRDFGFVTLFLAELNFREHSFRYVGAGHRADFLKTDGRQLSLPSTGLMLGIEQNVRYRCSPEIPFEAGDQLLLSTDGICETVSPGGHVFGREGMIDCIRAATDCSAEEAIHRLLTTCQDIVESSPPADDMTAVLIRRLGESGSN
ncbi:SpoIIE family protein phosphatase [Rubinisphaera margarita]|uniref:SpoIIE family protein phosphatase n=1 Tax=Rubinisphaera margarita TaxID=2909586 RepID=UPI001EE8D79C|nr:SpoIIE family protein phosphatase [Rubinisphaera margarita]MCG6157308.1 SpoIIE family protein phosphatase [Rubinisphaera margarita]